MDLDQSSFRRFCGRRSVLRDLQHTFVGICDQAGCSLADFRRIRDEVAPEFIEFCVNSIDWSRFGLIGFSVVFQQTLASLALARALKQRYPDIPIIMGGASFEDDIAEEIMRGCPQVDYIHCGDGEETFPQIVRRVYEGRSMQGQAGVFWRRDGDGGDGSDISFRRPRQIFQDERNAGAGFRRILLRPPRRRVYINWGGSQEVLLPIETARGCWWGMKNHCTFVV